MRGMYNTGIRCPLQICAHPVLREVFVAGRLAFLVEGLACSRVFQQAEYGHAHQLLACKENNGAEWPELGKRALQHVLSNEKASKPGTFCVVDGTHAFQRQLRQYFLSLAQPHDFGRWPSYIPALISRTECLRAQLMHANKHNSKRSWEFNLVVHEASKLLVCTQHDVAGHHSNCLSQTRNEKERS